MRYKVIYHLGDQIDLKTRVESGVLTLGTEGFEVTGGATRVSVPFKSVSAVEQFRLNGLGRMIRVAHANGTLFLTVVRFNLGGVFAMGNYLKAGELFEKLQQGRHQSEHKPSL